MVEMGGSPSRPAPVQRAPVQRAAPAATAATSCPAPPACPVPPAVPPCPVCPTGTPDINNRKTNMNLIRSTITTNMAGTYQRLLSKVSQSDTDKKDLRGQLQNIRAESIDLDHASETYEREFLDKKEILQLPVTGGLQTLQDIILLIFFIGLILVSLLMIAFFPGILTIIVVVMLDALILMAIRLYG